MLANEFNCKQYNVKFPFPEPNHKSEDASYFIATSTIVSLLKSPAAIPQKDSGLAASDMRFVQRIDQTW